MKLECSQENAALCDQVAQMQENLVTVKEERLFLLRKLCQQQGEVDPAVAVARTQQNNLPVPAFNVESVTPKKSAKKRNSVDGASTTETSRLQFLWIFLGSSLLHFFLNLIFFRCERKAKA